MPCVGACFAWIARELVRTVAPSPGCISGSCTCLARGFSPRCVHGEVQRGYSAGTTRVCVPIGSSVRSTAGSLCVPCTWPCGCSCTHGQCRAHPTRLRCSMQALALAGVQNESVEPSPCAICLCARCWHRVAHRRTLHTWLPQPAKPALQYRQPPEPPAQQDGSGQPHTGPQQAVQAATGPSHPLQDSTLENAGSGSGSAATPAQTAPSSGGAGVEDECFGGAFLEDKLREVDALVARVWATLPPNTLLLLASAHGDIGEADRIRVRACTRTHIHACAHTHKQARTHANELYAHICSGPCTTLPCAASSPIPCLRDSLLHQCVHIFSKD